jgi:hypothetical protein
MDICDNCGRKKIMGEQCVTGFPDYHVAGSRVEYCGFCDEPPLLKLTVGSKAIILEPDCPGGTVEGPLGLYTKLEKP